MRLALPPSLRIASGLLLAALLSIVGYQVLLRISHSPEALLKRADDLSWLNSWIAAAPLYHQAELEFVQEGNASRALYAHVSQVLAESESSRTGCINSQRRPRKIPQGLKPSVFEAFTARLKPCPFKARFMQPVLGS
jgi:hypothetical protein